MDSLAKRLDAIKSKGWRITPTDREDRVRLEAPHYACEIYGVYPGSTLRVCWSIEEAVVLAETIEEKHGKGRSYG